VCAVAATGVRRLGCSSTLRAPNFRSLLSLRSYEALGELWARHGIAREVSAQRGISDRVVRASFY
jgi:hypothetical protein